MAENRITDIHCPNCGGPAAFDIARQIYRCRYCGGEVGIDEALQEKQGFRAMQSEKIRSSIGSYRLMQATCSGCGAEVVFEENEAMATCAFCGRSLVRTKYLHDGELPESVIPFSVTPDEARELMLGWCRANRTRREAKRLREVLGDLRGFYLPYELIRGPVHMTVSRMDRGGRYDCEGFISDEFVNRSSQLDNLLLDGMEPFDLSSLQEFDPAFIAGHRVKISDIPDDELRRRARSETAQAYSQSVGRVMQSRELDIDADVSQAVRLPVLLPVYYVSDGELMAAVNGQTGKVSVRSLRDSHYYFLPWWFKALLATAAFTAALFGSLRLFGVPGGISLLITGLTAIIFVIVTLCLYSDTKRNSFRVVSGRNVMTSGGRTFRREHGELVLDDRILSRKVEEPVFFHKFKDGYRPVVLRFATPSRVLRMAALCIAALFLPVLLALLINGFDLSRLELGGSAVWFCIAVPTVPIYLLKFGIVELYDRPLIYEIEENGKLRRSRNRGSFKITKQGVQQALRIIFVPPESLAFWFAVASFFTMVYLTAFGFGD